MTTAYKVFNSIKVDMDDETLSTKKLLAMITNNELGLSLQGSGKHINSKQIPACSIEQEKDNIHLFRMHIPINGANIRLFKDGKRMRGYFYNTRLK